MGKNLVLTLLVVLFVYGSVFAESGGKWYTREIDGDCVFSFLENHAVACKISSSSGMFLFRNGRFFGPYTSIDRMEFSLNGESFGYTARDKKTDKALLIINNQEHARSHNISRITRGSFFSSGSLSYSYVSGGKFGGTTIHHNGNVFLGDPHSIGLLQSGTSILYAVKKSDEEEYFLDGKKISQKEFDIKNSVPPFSVDNRRHNHPEGGWMVLLPGYQSKRYMNIGMPREIASGIFFLVSRDDKKWSTVIVTHDSAIINHLVDLGLAVDQPTQDKLMAFIISLKQRYSPDKIQKIIRYVETIQQQSTKTKRTLILNELLFQLRQ